MSNKLQELNEVTSVQDSDLVYLVRNTNGVYTDHKVAKSTLVDTVVPTAVSDLENDTGFITGAGVEANVPLRRSISYDFSNLTAGNIYETPVLTNSTIAVDTWGAVITMGGQANDRLLLRVAQPKIAGLWDRNPSFGISLYDFRMYNAPLLIGFGGANVNENTERVGWVINSNLELSSKSSGGSADTTNTLDTTFAVNTNRELFIKVNSGTDVKYYVDGVLKATHTTNLPAGDASQFMFILDCTRDAGNAQYPFKLAQLTMEYDAVV